ncbi:MAG: matrixin family metalloprotease, partial [Dehalococcoidia bacterium]
FAAAFANWSDVLGRPVGALSGHAAAPACSPPRTAGGSETGGGSALMVPASLEGMTDESHRIVTGTVQSLRSCLNSEGASIITEVVLTPERHPKAPDGPVALGTKVTILVPGGRFGDSRLTVGTSPEFNVGERVVVFLREVEGQGLRLTEGFQSKFPVSRKGRVERAELSLAEFEAKVHQATDGTLAPEADPLFQPDLVVVEQPFAVQGQKWPDAAIPVQYNINPITNRPSQLTADQSRQAVINAFDTWEAVPSSYIAFNFAGDTGRVSGADGCSSGSPQDGFNDITWGIAGAHASGTLAVTISCFLVATMEMVDADIEVDFDHFGAAWMVDGSGACASGLYDLETVTLHEAGHLLGLDHPPNISCIPGTNGACPVMNPTYGGVRRTLCADDIDGATSLYPVVCDGRAVTKSGTAGNDILTGTAGPDVIHGLAGNDTIDGLGGNDVICGGDGRDTLDGKIGSDLLKGGRGNDSLYGGDGRDTLYGKTGGDLLKGGRGNDSLYGGDGRDTLYGKTGGDLLKGGYGNDRLYGGDGWDTLYGKIGNDLLKGGKGNDTLYGGRSWDTLYGNQGNDRLKGGYGNDSLDGGVNTDNCGGGPGIDTAVRCETVANVP